MQLLQLVEMYSSYTCSKLDTIPIEDGHPVVNLLTYYRQCNSHIWAQMKSHMTDKNKTFKTASVAKLIQKAANKIVFGIE
jgi:hypothetical protein